MEFLQVLLLSYIYNLHWVFLAAVYIKAERAINSKAKYRTRSNYSNILLPRTTSFSILFPSKFIEHAEFQIF